MSLHANSFQYPLGTFGTTGTKNKTHSKKSTWEVQTEDSQRGSNEAACQPGGLRCDSMCLGPGKEGRIPNLSS